MFCVLSLKEQEQSSRYLSLYFGPGISSSTNRVSFVLHEALLFLSRVLGKSLTLLPAFPVSQCCCPQRRDKRWPGNDKTGFGPNSVFMSLIWLKGNQSGEQLGRNGDALDEHMCNLVWSCSGTTAGHHMCLLMLVSCVSLWCSYGWTSYYSN